MLPRLAKVHACPKAFKHYAFPSRMTSVTSRVTSVEMPARAPAGSSMGLLFRQLFDPASSTYTYLLADLQTKEGVLIDPVLEQVERDLQIADELGARLLYGINTHCHADHITGTGQIKKLRPGVRSIISGAAGAAADQYVQHGDIITFGGFRLECRATPGHTDGCMSYYLPAAGMVFTGDALLIRGCGRTDFQQGNPSTLYDSVHSQLLSLPDATLVYPAHDYKGRTCSSVGEEKAHNLRLTKSKEQFVEIMDNLGLPYPKQINKAVPANLKCGLD